MQKRTRRVRRHSVDGTTGGRCQESYATMGYRHMLRERLPMSSSHVNKLEAT